MFLLQNHAEKEFGTRFIFNEKQIKLLRYHGGKYTTVIKFLNTVETRLFKVIIAEWCSH